MHSRQYEFTAADRDGCQIEAQALLRRSEAMRRLAVRAMRLSRQASHSASDARVRALGAHVRADRRRGRPWQDLSMRTIAIAIAPVPVPVPSPLRDPTPEHEVDLDQAA